jgi:two-component system, cell cycle response regulator
MTGDRETATVTAAAPDRTDILLAFSDAKIAIKVNELLATWRHQAKVVDSGAEALDRLQGGDPPGIALLDMDLASPGAVEITLELGRTQERRRTWLILTSANSGPEQRRAAIECGCDDFLPLPPDAMDLRMRIRVTERVRSLMVQTSKRDAVVEFHATHDVLTGLWNRETLLSLIFQETDRVQRMKTDLCLMLMNLDGFSRVNHEYGYEAGDRLLTGLANRFRRQLRSYDLIGRSGDDEFLLALPGCRVECALALAERLRTTILARPFAVGCESTTLTASFGVAASRGRSPLVVLREAERALAEAKLAGKNCARDAGRASHSPEELRNSAAL